MWQLNCDILISIIIEKELGVGNIYSKIKANYSNPFNIIYLFIYLLFIYSFIYLLIFIIYSLLLFIYLFTKSQTKE